MRFHSSGTDWESLNYLQNEKMGHLEYSLGHNNMFDYSLT